MESAVQRKSDSFIGRFENLTRSALKQGQNTANVKKIRRALDDKDSYAAELAAVEGLIKVEEVFKETLPTLVLSLMAAAGNAAGSELPLPPIEQPVATVMKSAPGVGRPAMRFDKSNPDAVTWAAHYAADLVRDITDESRDAINHVIAQRIASGASTQATARMVKMSVGMTQPHAKAVTNLADKLLAETSRGKLIKAGSLQFRVPKTGMTPAQLEKALTRYSERLTRVRSLNIARTATRTSSSEGQRQAWSQARQKGLLTGTEKRMWIASAGSCPICRGLDGETATLDGRFTGGVRNPPAHPGCTCTQSLTYD